MKKNITILILLSLFTGVLVTAGTTRLNRVDEFNSFYTTKSSNINSSACFASKSDKPIACVAVNRGYPLKFLHSSTVLIKDFPAESWAPLTFTNSWMSFRTATADWIIWSAVSASGLGLLYFLLGKAGITQPVKTTKKRR